MTLLTVALGLLPLAILVTSLVAGYILYRDHLFEIACALQNRKTFSSFSILPPRSTYPVASCSKNRDESFGDTEVGEAIASLVSYVRKINPDWIVGVHPGGRFLSVVVAEQAGIAANRCLYVRMTTRKDITFDRQVDSDAAWYRGRVLIVDDISRTGRTMQNLKTFLISQNYDPPNSEEMLADDADYGIRFSLDLVRFATLLVVSDTPEIGNRFRPDWVYRRTDNENTKLPWSGFSDAVRTAFDRRGANLEFDAKIILDYERLVKDYGYALERAKSYVRLPMQSARQQPSTSASA